MSPLAWTVGLFSLVCGGAESLEIDPAVATTARLNVEATGKVSHNTKPVMRRVSREDGAASAGITDLDMIRSLHN